MELLDPPCATEGKKGEASQPEFEKMLRSQPPGRGVISVNLRRDCFAQTQQLDHRHADQPQCASHFPRGGARDDAVTLPAVEELVGVVHLAPVLHAQEPVAAVVRIVPDAFEDAPPIGAGRFNEQKYFVQFPQFHRPPPQNEPVECIQGMTEASRILSHLRDGRIISISCLFLPLLLGAA